MFFDHVQCRVQHKLVRIGSITGKVDRSHRMFINGCAVDDDDKDVARHVFFFSEEGTVGPSGFLSEDSETLPPHVLTAEQQQPASTKIVAFTYISPRIPYVAFTYVAFTFVRSPTRSPGRDIDRPPGVYIFFFFFFCTFRSVLSFCTSVIVSNCFRPRRHQYDQIFRFQIRKRNLHAPWLRTFPPLPR